MFEWDEGSHILALGFHGNPDYDWFGVIHKKRILDARWTLQYRHAYREHPGNWQPDAGDIKNWYRGSLNASPEEAIDKFKVAWTAMGMLRKFERSDFVEVNGGMQKMFAKCAKLPWFNLWTQRAPSPGDPRKEEN